MEVKKTEEAERELSGGQRGGRRSKFEPVIQKWDEVGSDESIVLDGLSQNDVQNLRSLVYRRLGKKKVIVRSAKQGDDEYKAVVRRRRGNEYLRSS
jgi:hypothetical protein